MAGSFNLRDMLGSAFRPKQTDRSRSDIGKFIEGLESMTDEDLGVVVAVATVIRVDLEEKGHIPDHLFGDTPLPSTKELMRLQFDLHDLVSQFNKAQQHTDAVATLAIGYSIRCLNLPELRADGRRMWQVLARGFPHAEKVLKTGEENRGEPLPPRVWEEWNQIPSGLEPIGS
jgi:hypothetical protein